MNEGWSGKTGISHTMCQAADAAQTLEYSLLLITPSKHTQAFLQSNFYICLITWRNNKDQQEKPLETAAGKGFYTPKFL